MCNTDICYIAMENEAATWQKIKKGYDTLFHYGLYSLLDIGLNTDEADCIILLRNFFDNVKEKLEE